MDAVTRRRFAIPPAEQIGLLARVIVWSAIASLLAVALVLLARRGAVVHALLPPLCTVALLSSSTIAWSLRRLLKASRCSSAEATMADIGLTLSLLVLAASMTLPGSGRVDISAMWAILVFSEGLAWLRRWPFASSFSLSPLNPPSFSPRRPRRELNLPPETAGAAANLPAWPKNSPAWPPGAKKTEAPAPEATDRIARFDELPLPADVEQQLQRTVDAQGDVVISGRIQQKFVANQRTAAVHIAFCPPLAAVPEVKVEQVEGTESTVKVAEVLPLGVRIEVRLRRASKDPQQVTLTLHARGPQLVSE